MNQLHILDELKRAHAVSKEAAKEVEDDLKLATRHLSGVRQYNARRQEAMEEEAATFAQFDPRSLQYAEKYAQCDPRADEYEALLEEYEDLIEEYKDRLAEQAAWYLQQEASLGQYANKIARQKAEIAQGEAKAADLKENVKILKAALDTAQKAKALSMKLYLQEVVLLLTLASCRQDERDRALH